MPSNFILILICPVRFWSFVSGGFKHNDLHIPIQSFVPLIQCLLSLTRYTRNNWGGLVIGHSDMIGIVQLRIRTWNILIEFTVHLCRKTLMKSSPPILMTLFRVVSRFHSRISVIDNEVLDYGFGTGSFVYV